PWPGITPALMGKGLPLGFPAVQAARLGIPRRRLVLDEAFGFLITATAMPDASGGEIEHADQGQAAPRLLSIFVHISAPRAASAGCRQLPGDRAWREVVRQPGAGPDTGGGGAPGPR